MSAEPRERRGLARMLAAGWSVLRGAALGVLQLLAALILLFEEWGWRPLSELFGLIARWRPIARLELLIAGLPPWAALIVFAAPSAILLPVKLIGLWLLAKGQMLLAGLLLAGAKVVSTALVARIFMLTKPALMQLRWFAWAYHKLMPWKEAIFAEIRASWVWRYGRMVKTRVRHEARQAWQRWRPAVLAARDRVKVFARGVLVRARVAGRRVVSEMARRLGLGA